MTLAQLRTKLDSAKTGNDINEVMFNWNTVLNENYQKSYPAVFWNLDFISGIRQIRTKQEKQTITLPVFCLKKYTPDADRIPEYDSLIADLDAYLTKVNTDNFISVNLLDVSYKVYPEGFVSVDRELAISYDIILELWC